MAVFVNFEGFKEKGFLTPDNTNKSVSTAIESILTKVEKEYIRSVVGTTLATQVLTSVTDPEVLEFINGLEAENVSDDYKGVQYEIYNISAAAYYNSLGSQVSGNGAYVSTFKEKALPMSMRFSIFNTWQDARVANERTYAYLSDVSKAGFFLTWDSSVFHYLKSIAVW